MDRPRHQLTLAIVAFTLGLLVVVQARAQTGGAGLAGRAAQDLTVVVANVNARNDQLRTEVALLERDLANLRVSGDRGATALGQLRADLSRVRANAGHDEVRGPGVSIAVTGEIDGEGVEELLNELRNAGAAALAIGGVRLVPGSVVAGPPYGLSVDGTALVDPFEIAAIGAPETLTGSLTRIGGVVAQLAATYPRAAVTVTPVARLVLPPTTRDLVPTHGRPRL
jgi:uncharacterized protein YlxW (UPF0749 family)